MSVDLGACAGPGSRTGCDHLLGLLLEQVGPVELACTHLVDGAWALSVRLGAEVVPALDVPALATALGAAVWADGIAAGDPAWVPAARSAAQQLAAGRAPRVLRFPGQERLTGTVGVDQVRSLSAVAEVVGIAGTPTAGAALVTRDFVRPELVDGVLVLRVRPWGGDGEVAPFEVPEQVACCSVHG